MPVKLQSYERRNCATVRGQVKIKIYSSFAINIVNSLYLLHRTLNTGENRPLISLVRHQFLPALGYPANSYPSRGMHGCEGKMEWFPN